VDAAHRTLLRRLMPLAVVMVATWAYVAYGLQAEIIRDDALYAYCGQRVADGAAPYERVFDVTGPLASAVPALGVLAARQIGVAEHRGVQIEFVALSVLTVLAVYLLARAQTESVTAGAFAAVTFLGFQPLIRHGAGGHPKTFMLLMMTLGLLCVARRRWALAGVLVAAAALTWQVMVLVGLAALAAAAGEEPGKRSRAMLSVIAGALALFAVTVAWFVAQGALYELWECAFVSPTFLTSRASDLPPTYRIWRLLRSCYRGYTSHFALAWLGFVGLFAAFVESRRQAGGALSACIGSRWSAIFVSFVLLAGFSLFDFQNPSDAFHLLPLVSLGLGYILWRAIGALTGPDALIRPGQEPIAAALVVVALLAPTVISVKFHPGEGLDEQIRISHEIADMLGDGSIQCVNAPQVLYLAELRSATRHLVLSPPLVDYVDSREPGGVDGWLRTIWDTNVDLIVVDSSELPLMPRIERFVKENYEVARVYEEWTVYERPG